MEHIKSIIQNINKTIIGLLSEITAGMIWLHHRDSYVYRWMMLTFPHQKSYIFVQSTSNKFIKK